MILGISGFSSCKLFRCSWNLTDVCLCVVKKLLGHIMQIRCYGCRLMFTYATMGMEVLRLLFICIYYHASTL